jgi:hypothetical protein
VELLQPRSIALASLQVGRRRSPHVKDAFPSYVTSGRRDAINSDKHGTKAAAHYVLDVPASGSETVRLRLAERFTSEPFDGFDVVFDGRIRDADEFYGRIAPPTLTEDERLVYRQAFAGMLWTVLLCWGAIGRGVICRGHIVTWTVTGRGSCDPESQSSEKNSSLTRSPDSGAESI